LGGVIVISAVSLAGVSVETHYWNRLPSGLEIDLTREQFNRGEQFGEPRILDPATSRKPKPDSLRRVGLLSGRVEEALGAQTIRLAVR
jgi:hypothetical protein